MDRYLKVVNYFPPRIRREVDCVIRTQTEKISEIHIVRGSGSSVRFTSRRVFLGIEIREKDINDIFEAMTQNALYAHRRNLSDGYIPLDRGVRVGVCGQARYEGDELRAVGDVSSLLIRFPCEKCEFTEELIRAFGQTERGMLIFAPAFGGKTTALRALIRGLAAQDTSPKISVIDERCEFDPCEFSSLAVDLFRGYRRGEGMQIALRVMSPDIIAVDEIGASEESLEMLDSLLSGVKFIATAHAKSYFEIKRRRTLEKFFDLGVFDTFVRIFRGDCGFGCEVIKERENA